jgi:hypothetical protein
MPRKTEEVYELVKEVLKTIPAPYSEDITDEVCYKIETNPVWLREYNNLCAELKKFVVNNSIGYYTKSITGKQSHKKAPARKSTIIKSFTRLK